MKKILYPIYRVQIFTLLTSVWSLGPDVPEPVYYTQCLALPGGKILVFYANSQPSSTPAAILNTLASPTPIWQSVTAGDSPATTAATNLAGACAVNLKPTTPGNYWIPELQIKNWWVHVWTHTDGFFYVLVTPPVTQEGIKELVSGGHRTD